MVPSILEVSDKHPEIVREALASKNNVKQYKIKLIIIIHFYTD
jgi:hypothetical protein